MSDRIITAGVTAAVGLALLVLARWGLRAAFSRYLRRAAERQSPEEMASLRTRLSVLQRVLVAFLAAIVAWSILSIFPTTDRLATTLLASSAVLALIFGLAFSAPLGNLGAGVLLAFTQPVRLGDRITVGDVTGQAEQITLIHTVLLTDDDRRIFIPNGQMVSSVVINRTIQDRRRVVSVSLPVALGAPVDRARAAVLEAVRRLEVPAEDVSVRVGDIQEKTAWLALTAYVPPDANVTELAAEMREHAVSALAGEELLPA